MLITISNTAVISNLSEPEKQLIQKSLTVPNPIYNKKSEMGLSLWNIPLHLEYYEELDKNTLVVPVGIIPDLVSKLLESGSEISANDIIDLRLQHSDKKYFSTLNFSGTLRDYQEEMVKICLSKTLGVIEAMTGSGKTITFVKLILERKVSTIITVDTIELANQTIKSLCKFSNLQESEVGFIGNGKFIVKPISVALLQTLNTLNDDKFKILNDTFGQVIADEVHKIAASTYYAVMNRFKAKYKFGFSATPFRADGLTDVIHFATGPKIYIAPKEKLENVLINPTYKQVETTYSFPLFASSEYQDMISDMATNKARNDLIVKLVKEQYADNFVCLLCSRQEQVKVLTKELGDKACMLLSSISKKERKQTIHDLNEKKKQYVVSTYGLFSTGIDIPHLDVAVLCAPMKSEVVLRQTAGRLMRKAENKTSALIVDIVDNQVSLLKNQARIRSRIFKKLSK